MESHVSTEVTTTLNARDIEYLMEYGHIRSDGLIIEIPDAELQSFKED